MKSARGFSIIELLVAVMIILIIAAIAIPSFMRSKMAANEASAVETVRDINNAQATYASTYPDFGFAPNLASLGPGDQPSTAAAGLIDISLSASGIKDGYQFATTGLGAVPRTTYTLTAAPKILGKTGQRAFCSNQDQAVRFNSAGDATLCLAGTSVVN